MTITLETVRNVLRDTFGRESFIASFITRVEASEDCPTAGINADGVMKYNPAFTKQYVTTHQDLFCLIAHELMHSMFGHFVHGSGQLENIAGDLVINAILSRAFASASGSGSLFRKFYQPMGVEGLLRPASDMQQSRYGNLYQSFYPTDRWYTSQHKGDKLSTGEVIQTLKVLTRMLEIKTLVLLGEHACNSDSTNCTIKGALPVDVLVRIADDMKKAVKSMGGKKAGHGDGLIDFFLEVLQTHASMKKVMLERFTTRRKVDKFKASIQRPRIGVSPIPIQPSKRDFVLLAAGVPPFHYHNVAYRQAFQEVGLAIYLDVSGSVNQHLPEIIGMLRSLKQNLNTIFLFSNKVVEVPFTSLLKGQVQTTYGTDFNCIADHVLTNRFEKAVIITDGYASLNEKKKYELKERHLHLLTILFGGRKDSPEFETLGDVVQLEDVIN